MFSGPLLVDTNLIIECHAVGCWAVLAGAYQLETVEKCIEETQTGKQQRSPAHQIDEHALRASFHAVNKVGPLEIAEVELRGGRSIHEGERHLWAHALTRTDAWKLAGPDRGSMLFGYNNGFGSRIISLEELFTLRNLPYPRGLMAHYGRAWHAEQMTKLRLGIL